MMGTFSLSLTVPLTIDHFYGTVYINFLYAVLEYKQKLQSTTIKWSRVGYICYLIHSPFVLISKAIKSNFSF